MVYFHYNFVIRTHIYINQKITFIFQPFLYNPSSAVKHVVGQQFDVVAKAHSL